ncbi:alanine racemase [Gordonia sp. NPDC003950]
MIDTPYLSVDTDRLDANLHSMARLCAEAGIALRPHAKTHKCVEIAERQNTCGAQGLTVATIGEAEVFAAAADRTGCRDLFIAYPLWVTADKGARVRALADQVSLRIGVASVGGARQLGMALDGNPSGRTVEAIVEVDSGQHRTGVAPGDAGTVAAAAADAGLDVVGVFTFPGHGYGPGDSRRRAAREEADALSSAAESLRTKGIDPRVRSGGSTPTIAFADTGVLTEIRPGVYPFFDAQQIELGACGFDDVSLSAVTTVVHRSGTRIVVDAGSKILGADRPGWTTGFGRVAGAPDARITSLSEHHGVIEYPDTAATIPAVGEVIRVIPNHVCAAVNLVDELIVESDSVEPQRWPVTARGRNS